MRKKNLFLLAVLTITCYGAPALTAEPPAIKTLAAHVVNVAEDGSSLAADFHHPATDKVYRLVFYTDDQTGLSGIDSLKDLRAGQVVSIDYVIGNKGRRLIRHIAKVKLSGPPAGLENFHGI